MDNTYQLKYPNPRKNDYNLIPLVVVVGLPLLFGFWALERPGPLGFVLFVGSLFYASYNFKLYMSANNELVHKMGTTHEIELIRKFTGKKFNIVNLLNQPEHTVISVADEFFVYKINNFNMTDSQIYEKMFTEGVLSGLGYTDGKKASIKRLANELIHKTASQSSKGAKLLPIHVFLKSVLSVENQEYPMGKIVKLVEMYLKDRGIERVKKQNIPLSG